jgi:hypothetical protein
VIELGVETGPAASDTASSLGDDVPPESVVKSMGVMVAGDTTVALDPVARALGASGGDSRGSGGSSGKRPWEPGDATPARNRPRGPPYDRASLRRRAQARQARHPG